jgi:hypothetical protein
MSSSQNVNSFFLICFLGFYIFFKLLHPSEPDLRTVQFQVTTHLEIDSVCLGLGRGRIQTRDCCTTGYCALIELACFLIDELMNKVMSSELFNPLKAGIKTLPQQCANLDKMPWEIN